MSDRDLEWRGHKLPRRESGWVIQLGGMTIDVWQRRSLYCACIYVDGRPACYCLDRDTHTEAIDGAAAASTAAIMMARGGKSAAAPEVLT